MPERMDFILGFDPGGKGNSGKGNSGKGKFGWSVCRIDGDKLRRPAKTGLATNARNAIDQVERSIKELSDGLQEEPRVLAAGIDAPMFWSITGGNRRVDEIVKKALKDKGCPGKKIGGTVQNVNSLRGACLVQGILLGKYLHETYTLKITETHPKALEHLLKKSGQSGRINPLIEGLDDHERDATLAAFAAWSMHERSPGWRDIRSSEEGSVQPFDTPVSYWMPIR